MVDPDAKRDRVLKAALDCRAELVAYARALIGNYTAAEDAVQDTLHLSVEKPLVMKAALVNVPLENVQTEKLRELMDTIRLQLQ